MRVFLVICFVALAGCGSSAHDEALPTRTVTVIDEHFTSGSGCSEMAQKLRREMERQEPAARGGDFNSGCSEISIPLKK